MKHIALILIVYTLFAINPTAAQKTNDPVKKEGYGFTEEFRLAHTAVPNQYRSGTCWSFSGVSFLESELLRTGKDSIDLSEMFIVNHCYYDKAKRYVRMHGHLNFGGGGAFHDVIYVMKNYGLLTEDAYPGLEYGTEKHVHGELDKLLTEKVKAVTENKNRTLSPVWEETVKSDLEIYLGKLPGKFNFQNKEYTAKNFVKSYMELDPDDYIEISSFIHHPFYEKFILEVPDNWLWGEVYNVKLDEMMQIIDHCLDNGYTVAWASDVSHKGFSYSKNGLAVIPDADIKNMNDLELAKWTELSQSEKNEMLYRFDEPAKEKNVTQEMRQEAFDNYNTTDDHGMHIIGKAEDKNGTPYYIVKNSWGKSGPYDGYFYASKPFIRLQTTNIMVNKNALPKEIKKKLDL